MAAGKHRRSTAPEPVSRREWGLLAAASLGKLVLYTVGAFLFWALVTLPFGLSVTTVASGSMEPRILTGDVVAALPVPEDSLREHQVILFEDPAVPDRLRLHRILNLSLAGIETQGDANPDPDPMLVGPEAVVGVGFLRVPFLGVPVNWFHSGDWLRLGSLLIALAGALSVANLDRDLRRQDKAAELLSEGAPQSVLEALPEGYTGRPNLIPQLGVWLLGRRPSFPVVKGFTGPSRFSQLGGGVLAGFVVAAVVLQILTGTSAAAAAFFSSTSTAAELSAAGSFLKPWTNATFHWGYNEQAPNLGTALDDAGSSLENGTLAGGVTRGEDSDSPFVTLDGGTGQIYSPRFSGSPSNFSIETWFRTTTTRGGKLMGYGSSQSGASSTYDRHLYMSDSGKLIFGLQQPSLFGLFSSPVTVGTPGSYNDGAWHLVTVTMSSSAGSTIYVDGVPAAASSSMTTGQSVSGGYWRVGYDSIGTQWTSAPSSRYFAGSLDNTTLYPTVLPASEVAAHFAYGR